MRRLPALALAVTLFAAPAFAGLIVTGSNGIAITGADGVVFDATSGLVTSGADGLLSFGPNGIAAPWTDALTTTGAGAATSILGAGLEAVGVEETTVASADGFTATGPNGIAITGADGSQYLAESVSVVSPNGIAITGADGIAITGADGVELLGSDSAAIASADGLVASSPTGIAITGADGIAITGADGLVTLLEPAGIAITGADGIAITGADGIAITGADGVLQTTLDELPVVGGLGLQSLDPELALLLDRVTDDSNVNAAIVYHAGPTDSDVADLVAHGVLGGTRYRALPVVLVTATKRQLVAVSHLPAVRAIYGVRTFDQTADPSRSAAGAPRIAADADLAVANGGVPLTGRGVTVAVLDTGVNGGHPDLAGRVTRNVVLLDQQSLPLGFSPPINLEGLPTTDLVSGHGTFVAGVVAGNGTASGGRIRGIAPEASIVGLSAGALDLPHVLAGFDYLLERGAELGVRVVNCSFSANTVFDLNDPVNVATKLLVERGISVVFSAGNAGPGWNTLNPYAAAPWVVSVGATDDAGRLADFSSRGAFGSATFRPTLVASGVGVLSLRSSPLLSVTGALGIQSGEDLRNLSLAELPFYTTSSGTSFSAPLVAGTIALMLEANPSLAPDRIKEILSRSATPLPPALAHEAGAGRLNAHAAVLEAAFADRRMGAFRATLERGHVRFLSDPVHSFEGTVSPLLGYTKSLTIPSGTLRASLQIAWGPMVTVNDLGLSLYGPDGGLRGSSNSLNLLGLLGRRERVALTSPPGGSWRMRATNTLGLLGTHQQFTGALEIARAEIVPLADLGGLSAQSRDEIHACVRSYVMAPFSNRFRPAFAVSRGELAETLLLGGRAPQYLAGAPLFPDVRDARSRLGVESAQTAPGGPLFPDAPSGASFHPHGVADRLTAAVALVRAAGLRDEAERRAGAQLPVSDATSIPAELRGYVALALERGFVTAESGAFRPAAPLTRAALAHAMSVLMNR